MSQWWKLLVIGSPPEPVIDLFGGPPGDDDAVGEQPHLTSRHFDGAAAPIIRHKLHGETKFGQSGCQQSRAGRAICFGGGGCCRRDKEASNDDHSLAMLGQISRGQCQMARAESSASLFGGNQSSTRRVAPNQPFQFGQSIGKRHEKLPEDER